MVELKPWQELPAGGAVSPTGVAPSRTGGWRTGLKPAVEPA